MRVAGRVSVACFAAHAQAAAIVVAALWVAIVATAEISVTDFFQVRTFAEEVYTQAALGAFDFSDEQGAAERGAERRSPLYRRAGLWIGLLLSTALALVAIVAAARLFADLADAPHRPPWIWRLERRRWPAAIVLWCIMLLVAGVPLGNLLVQGGRSM